MSTRTLKNLKDIIEIIQGDITTLNVDAIVNAANNALMGGGGVDGAIHRAAGPKLKDECRTLRGCKTGKAKITKAYELPAKHIIHTVGPVWNNGTESENGLLASAYLSSMELAEKYALKSIAFPSISTGAYRFPFEKATTIALCSIGDFLIDSKCIEKVYLVAFLDKDYQRMQKLRDRLLS